VKVVLLAGGLGGSRFARAVTETLDPKDVTVVGNVGDDLEVSGLHVSPDLDTILYTLAGVLDEDKGWGRAAETWNARDAATELGGETWFQLGDRDLGLHLVRTEALGRGEPLSAVTARLAAAFGVEATLRPATDDRLRTWVATPAGQFPFQEWFVRRGHKDEVDGVRFEGAEQAQAAPGVLDALDAADLIAIAPSNPFVSIGPILAVAEIRAALEHRRVPAVAVSPLIGGRTVRGPADRMLARLAGGTAPAQVTDCYKGLIDALVIDEADADDADDAGIRTIVTRTLMSDRDARRSLAEAVLGIPGGTAAPAKPARPPWSASQANAL
jgi:LPPG:FO 2-phospho-L-lactate transferase